jgi:tetratricopeptide (TPR) repeat protein
MRSAARIQIRCLSKNNSYDEAATELHKCIDSAPSYWPCCYFLGQVFEQQHKFDEAVATLQKARQIKDRIAAPLAELTHTYAMEGHRAEALRELDELLGRSKRTYVLKYILATVYAGLGHKNEALAKLEAAYTEHSCYLGFIKLDPELDSLRSDPRFAALLQRMGLSQ